MGTSPTTRETRGTVSFSRTVNAVSDLGMDNTGQTAIDTKLKNAVASGTLIEFPPGDYLVTTEIFADNVDNFGMKGTGASPSDVKFVFPAGNSGAPDPANYVMLYSRGGSGFLLENFEIHQTNDQRTAASLIVYKSDALEIHDVHWTGFNPRDSYAKGTCLYPSVTTESGVGHVSNVSITGGGVVSVYPHRRGGVQMQYNHKGDLVFDSLDIRELGSSAFRASNCTGVVTLQNSYFENNDNCSFRIGGGNHPSKQSRAVYCTVVADKSKLQYLPSGENYENMEGARIDANGNGWHDAIIENCEFDYQSVQSGWARGVITAPSFTDHASFTIRGSAIRVDCDNVAPVWASPPKSASSPVGVTMEDVHLTGAATSWTDTNGVVTVQSRSGTSISDCCIDFPNANEAGVSISNSSGCSISNTSISVGGQPTVFTSSTVDTTNITSGESCRLPGQTSPPDDDTSSEEPAPTAVEQTLRIAGKGVATNYSFSVDGSLTSSADIESYDTVADAGATGWITDSGTYDEFTYTGRLTSFEFLEGDADVYLNGTKVAPGNLIPDKHITLLGEESTESVYSVSVSGIILQSRELTGWQEDVATDTINGSIGGGGGRIHRYVYSGAITSVSVDGPADVLPDE